MSCMLTGVAGGRLLVFDEKWVHSSKHQAGGVLHPAAQPATGCTSKDLRDAWHNAIELASLQRIQQALRQAGAGECLANRAAAQMPGTPTAPQ